MLDQEDPVVINTIREAFDGPSSEPYNLSYPDKKDNSQDGQQAYLLEILGKKVRSRVERRPRHQMDVAHRHF